MTGVDILYVLKFLGLAVVAGSTIWGLTQKTTQESSDGRKSLTPAGQVAVALAIVSFLTAVVAQGVENLAKQADKEAAAREAAAREATEKSRELAERAENARAERDGRLLALALANKQQLLFLREAEKQRLRDDALARDVNFGTQQSLGRANRALNQLERLLHPLGDVRAYVAWEFPLGPARAPAVKEFFRQAAADWRSFARQHSAGGNLVSGEIDDRTKQLVGITLSGEKASSLLQEVTAVTSFTAQVAIFGSGDLQAITAFAAERGALFRSGDLGFRIFPDETFSYAPASGDNIVVRYSKSAQFKPRKTGEMFSVLDLEGATVALQLAAHFAPHPLELPFLRQGQPAYVVVTTPLKTYRIEGSRFRKIDMGAGAPLFVASPLLRS